MIVYIKVKRLWNPTKLFTYSDFWYRTTGEESGLGSSPVKLDAESSSAAVGTSNEDDMKGLTVSDLKALFAR